jgi:NADH-quinone oxidoreductase subunit M
MLHAGVLKKFGLYGLIRIALPMVPDGMQAWLTPLLFMLLGNLLWCGLVTISQKRFDNLLGNASVMHMGYIFLAIATFVAYPQNTIAIPAAVILMFAHGISVALLFGLADKIERSTGTLDMDELGGLAKTSPALAFLFGIAAFTAMGLTVSANFVGEVLIFLATFQQYSPTEGLGPVQIASIFAIWGVVISAVYMLRAFRKMFHGPLVPRTESVADLPFMVRLPSIILIIALVAVGLYPNLLLNLLK